MFEELPDWVVDLGGAELAVPRPLQGIEGPLNPIANRIFVRQNVDGLKRWHQAPDDYEWKPGGPDAGFDAPLAKEAMHGPVLEDQHPQDYTSVSVTGTSRKNEELIQWLNV